MDGSEYYLSTPYMLGPASALAGRADDKPGLYAEDVDDDGRILQMRVKNPDGGGRSPRKTRGHGPQSLPTTWALRMKFYYDLAPGRPRGTTTRRLPERRPEQVPPGLHQAVPDQLGPSCKAAGIGDYPFAEPEMKAIGDFILAHPNIVSSMCYHTSGGGIPRPLCDKPDRAMDSRDLAIYRALGGDRRRGYRVSPEVGV